MTDLHDPGPRSVPTTVPTTDDALLDEVSRHAGALVRDGLECAVVLREFRSSRVAGTSDPRVRRCGAVEQADRSGPGLTAIEEDRVVVVAAIGRTRRWPSWRETAVREGFRTAVAVPAAVGPGVDAAVVLYGATDAPWQRHELRAAAAFACDVARLVALELEVGRLRCLSEELFAAVSARDVIGQATGIVMGQRSCGPEEALAVLRQAAEHRGIMLRDLATMLVSEMTRSDVIRAAMFADGPNRRTAVGTEAHGPR
jgi:hypothetical protein